MKLFHRSSRSDAATDAALAPARRSWFGRIGGILGGGVNDALWESLEEVLIAGDTGVATTAAVLDRVRESSPRSTVEVRERLSAEFVSILRGPASPPRGRLWGLDEGTETPPPPAVVLVVGVNGSGKTTAIARLAHAYREAGDGVLCAAGDTFRAAAIEQLQAWGERLGVDVIAHQQGADAAAVAFDAIEAARARAIDVVFVDTAGRLHNKSALMDELTKMGRVIERHLGREADEVLLVLDATTGQNGLEQARAFTQSVGVTAVMLTKLDGTAKGGIVFAIATELGLPVRFIGTGQEAGDIAPFDAQQFVASLLVDPAPAGP